MDWNLSFNFQPRGPVIGLVKTKLTGGSVFEKDLEIKFI